MTSLTSLDILKELENQKFPYKLYWIMHILMNIVKRMVELEDFISELEHKIGDKR